MISFEEAILNYLDTLELGVPIYTDRNDTDASLSLISMPGSRVIREYYDDVVDKALNYILQIKGDVDERDHLLNALQKASDALGQLDELEHEKFELNRITVSNEPFTVNVDEHFVYFRVQFTAEITVF